MRLATCSIIAAFLLATFTTALWPDGSQFGVPTVVAQDEDPFGSNSDDSDIDPFGSNDNSGKNELDDPFGSGIQNPFGGKPVATKPNPKTSKLIKKAITAAGLESQIREALKSECSFEFDETPFAEIMATIRESHKFNLLLHISAMDDSLNQDTPITFRAKKLPLSSALKLMLEQYNATFVIRDGVMQIISLDVASDPEFFSREIIDCRGLIGLIAQQHASKLGQMAAGKKPTEVTGTPLHIAERTLEGLVMMTVDPEGWSNTNGDGTLQIVAGCMVISQNQQTIAEIHELIDELTEKLSAENK